MIMACIRPESFVGVEFHVNDRRTNEETKGFPYGLAQAVTEIHRTAYNRIEGQKCCAQGAMNGYSFLFAASDQFSSLFW